MKNMNQLLADAKLRVKPCQAAEAISRHAAAGTVFIDVRDEIEIRSEGRIPGSVHASRGMLEFHVAPDSPYHDEIFEGEREFIFYCQDGLKAALAAQCAQDLGLRNVSRLDGGLKAWRRAGGPVEGLGYLTPLRMQDLLDPYSAPAR